MLNPVFTVTSTTPVSVGAGSQTGGNPVSVTLAATPAPAPAKAVEPQSMTQSMVRLSGLLVGGDPRTGDILAGLAMLFARSLNVQRLEGETAELFGRRLAAIILEMKPADRAAVQRSSVLRNFGISAQSFAAALNNPNSAVAARVVALTEAPQQSDRQFVARAAEQSYADDGSADHHTNDVLRFRAPQPDRDQRSGDGSRANLLKAEIVPQEQLQEQLKARFSEDAEPVKTRRSEASPMPLPEQSQAKDDSAEPAEQHPLLQQTGAKSGRAETAPQQPAAAAATRVLTETASSMMRDVLNLTSETAKDTEATQKPATQAKADLADKPLAPVKAETAEKPSTPVKAETVQIPLAARRETGAQEDNRAQTLMVFKGLTEVISTLVDKTTDTLKTLLDADPATLKPQLPAALLPDEAAVPEQHDPASVPFQKDLSSEKPADAAALIAAAVSDETDEAIFDPRLALARHPEPEADLQQEAAMLPQQPKTADGVPYAIIPYPPGRNISARKATDLRRQAPFDGDEAEGDADQYEADERRERKAATPEPLVIEDKPFEAETPLARRPSDTERAFHMYQRMGGF